MIRPHTRAPTARAAIQAPIHRLVTVLPPSVTAGGSQPVEASPRRFRAGAPAQGGGGQRTDERPGTESAPGRRGDERSCWRTAAPFVWRRSTDRGKPYCTTCRRRSGRAGLPSKRGAPPRRPRATGLLDAARGPLHPAAARTFRRRRAAAWADPTRLHPPGRRARALLDTAREVLAEALGVRPDELSVHASPESGPRARADRAAPRPPPRRRPRGGGRHGALGGPPPARAEPPVPVDRSGGSTSARTPARWRAVASPPRCSRPRTPRWGPVSRSRRSTRCAAGTGRAAAARRDGIAGPRPARQTHGVGPWRRLGRRRRRRVVRRPAARPARRAHRHPVGAAGPPP